MNLSASSAKPADPTYFLEGVIHDKSEMADFEGPLSLILLLLSKNKIEIRDIKISEILDQYLEYLNAMEKLDLEIASEFVQMASYLLYIKTRMLLTEEKEVTELEQLIASLEQLKCKDKQIKSQDEELSSLAEKLARQQETLEAQQKKLASQKKKLSSQQDTLKEQQSALDEKTELLEEQQEKIDKIIGVKAEVVEALQKEFEKKNLNVDIDPQTGALTLNANVMFDYDQAELTDSGKMTLSMVLPTYCKVLLDDSYKKYLGEIIIDGYTDTDGDYSYNLELSQKRSLAVAQYLLDIKSDFLKDSQVQELKDCLTVNGHSMSDPVLDAEGNVDKDASRRVEVKFRLKDEEMIQELNKIMQGDSAESDSTAQKKEKNQKENQDNKQ